MRATEADAAGVWASRRGALAPCGRGQHRSFRKRGRVRGGGRDPSPFLSRNRLVALSRKGRGHNGDTGGSRMTGKFFCHSSIDNGRRLGYKAPESSRPVKDAVRVMPGGGGECGARGRSVIGCAPGRSGHHACRHYDRRARCVAGSGRGNLPTKPGPGRTKGQHTPWQEPWWNAGRRARPIAEGRRKPPSPWRDPRAVSACGTDDSATAGVPLSFIRSS